ncbi:hypothetical protein H5410_006909, partial [Solanum commersonii]
FRESGKTTNQNMVELSKTVEELKDQFMSFHIIHVERVWTTLATFSWTSSGYLEVGFNLCNILGVAPSENGSSIDLFLDELNTEADMLANLAVLLNRMLAFADGETQVEST